MNKFHRAVLLLFVALCLGCGALFGGGSSGKEYYLLAVPRIDPGQTSKEKVYLRNLISPSYIGGKRIVYSFQEGTRNFYQRSFWAEPAESRIKTVLGASLRDSGRFADVVFDTIPIGEYLTVDIKVEDFFVDASKDRPLAIGVFEYSLVDGVTGEVRRTAKFKNEAEVVGKNMTDMIKGFDNVISALTKDLITFLEQKRRAYGQ